VERIDADDSVVVCAGLKRESSQQIEIAMSEINIICPHCYQTMQGEEGYRGMQIHCPTCNQLFVVVDETSSSAIQHRATKVRRPTESVKQSKQSQTLIECPQCAAKISAKDAFCSLCGCNTKVPGGKSLEPKRIIRPPEASSYSEWAKEHIQCPNCNEFARNGEISCVWCRHSLQGVSSVYWVENLRQTRSMGRNCPLCGGQLERMDAGLRGTAFGAGNLLGAFTHTHRCSSCGHLV
jgi:hypothetical protein